MSNGAEQHYCRKEKEIAEICTDLGNIKRIVMGNGEGLSTTVPKLYQQVEMLNKNVETNNTLTSGVLRFKDELEGQTKGKERVRKTDRWIIGSLITIALGLLSALIVLLVTVV